VDISGPAKKPKAKGKASFLLILFALAVFAALIAFATAAVVSAPQPLASVAAVWNEVKPVLVLLLQIFAK
jgi:hypothetical protein